MDVRVAEITEVALTLSNDDRRALAEKLYESLEEDTPPISAAWREEIRRRIEEVRSGLVEPIDGELVFAEARERLRK